MKEGDVVLSKIAQSDGAEKVRPVVLLRRLPPFDDWLVCGITTQLRHCVVGFDELLMPGDSDFASSGIKSPSLVRLGFLAVRPLNRIVGVIGSLSSPRHQRLLQRLSDLLRP